MYVAEDLCFQCSCRTTLEEARALLFGGLINHRRSKARLPRDTMVEVKNQVKALEVTRLVMTNIAMENCPVEIVSFPIKMMIFHSFVNIYQRVPFQKATVVLSSNSVPKPFFWAVVVVAVSFERISKSILPSVWVSSRNSDLS